MDISKIITKANDLIAARATLVMSTMWCVYAFTFWSMLPVMLPKTQNFVFYVSGGVIQLVALPLIMVGQNVLSKKSEERAQQDHETIMAEFAEIKEMHAELKLIGFKAPEEPTPPAE